MEMFNNTYRKGLNNIYIYKANKDRKCVIFETGDWV